VPAARVSVPAVEAAESPSRARLVFALVAALGLGAIVVVVVALGGDEGSATLTAAPPACIRAWNADAAATAYGRHNFNFHDYDGALVTFLTPDGAVVEEEGGGAKCAVIFPSRVLDPEPFAAGQVLQRDRWQPISELPAVELARVGELQAEAARTPNTTLDLAGRLTER
jgi:hypothetical protein